MKKLIFVIIFLTVPYLIYSQSITEELIVRFDNLQSVDGYSFKYDEKTGTYLYLSYDTTNVHTNKLFSNRGNSDNYDFIDVYNCIFDSDGNYYVICSNNFSDTTGIYFIIKNGKEIDSFDNLNLNWAEKNGLIYFISKKNEKSCISSYNISENSFTKGKEYDDIILCSYPNAEIEGEPQPEIGFNTPGEPYYIAKDKSKTFVVIGTEEQKKYSDIDPYNFTADKNGNIAYVAKNAGNFDYAGNAFVVCNNKEYKKFDYIYNIIFNTEGIPVYTAADSVADGTSERLMEGDNAVSKTYTGGLYNVEFTKKGTLYFIASEKKKKSEDFESFVVYGGKEGARYQSVNRIKTTPNDLIYYMAQKSDTKSVLVSQELTDNIFDEYEINYPSVIDAFTFSDGEVAYVGAIYGNYQKKIKDKYYVYIRGEKFGPYEGIQPIDNITGDYIKFDNYNYKNNYFFIFSINNSSGDYLATLNSNKGMSSNFSEIQNAVLYKEIPLYTASYMVDKVNYTYKYRVYYNNKSISPEYDAINDYKFDEKTGIVTFIGLKDKEFVNAKIKL
jgi:hypothetical protein